MTIKLFEFLTQKQIDVMYSKTLIHPLSHKEITRLIRGGEEIDYQN